MAGSLLACCARLPHCLPRMFFPRTSIILLGLASSFSSFHSSQTMFQKCTPSTCIYPRFCQPIFKQRMKRHRFFGKLTDPQNHHQIPTVLKLRPEEHVVMCDGEGNETEMTVSGTVIETRQVDAEPKRHIILYAALLKRENFEAVVQKATELGAKEIVPLITERTVKLGFKRERLEAIVREAAELSGRGVIPIIHEPMKFEDAMRESLSKGSSYFFDTNRCVDEPTSAFFAHSEMSTKRVVASLHLFVGPEGGWSEQERNFAKQNGLETVSLGPLIMRGETAAMIATFLAVHIL